MAELNYEIKQTIACLSEEKSGWTKELNLISWNGNEPKYDIRPWSEDHQKMGKGITLTKDNIEFPVHFNRTKVGLRHVIEVHSEEIIKEIKRGIEFLRTSTDNDGYWYTSYGDLFVIVFKDDGDQEYYVLVTKDFYETYIPFEKEDYND